jgi:DNA-binding response OmpR family regulator
VKAKILIADDETNITDVCARYLEREGYAVVIANDGNEAMEIWRRENPDLIVLDLMMPKLGGMQVCEQIRYEQDVPIVMLTARGEEPDRLMGLTVGADDYITKPFSPRELVLRIHAILRRTRALPTANENESVPDELVFPELVIRPLSRIAAVAGQPVDLTVKEFDLLWLLARNPGRVFSRNQLLDLVWDTDFYGDATTVTVHIRRLREKVEPVPSQPRYIKTVWGIGYKFESREQE